MSSKVPVIVNRPAPRQAHFAPLQEPAAGTFKHSKSEDGNKDIPKVFTPLKIRGVEFQNRVFVSLSSLIQFIIQMLKRFFFASFLHFVNIQLMTVILRTGM